MSVSLGSKYADNISTVDRLVGRLNYLKKYPYVFFKFRAAYSNYLTVLLSVYNKKYPVNGRLRNGQTVTISNEREAWYAMLSQIKTRSSDSFEINYDIKNEHVKITSKSKSEVISLSQGITNGDVWGVFVKQEYGRLPVKNKIVVDIGANIGDSSIYFSLQNAKKIVALEPFPKNYHIAKENIRINELESKIILLLAGCSGRLGEITIDDEAGSAFLHLKESKKGTKVPLLTLEKIVEDYEIENDAILKMDCEGCEYDSILSTSPSILKRFSHIQLEYHYGCRNLVRKLQSCGFKVTASRPTRWIQYETGQTVYGGSLLASIII